MNTYAIPDYTKPTNETPEWIFRQPERERYYAEQMARQTAFERELNREEHKGGASTGLLIAVGFLLI